jgi:predicted kinase
MPAAELAGLEALPLFLSLRALVRAKVDGLRLATVGQDGETRRDALRYFAAAETLLAPAPLRLIGIGGLSGTGKSTLSERLAPAIGRPPGGVHLRSDVVRKRLLGVGEFDRLPDTAYGPTITEQVFGTLRREAEIALRAGQSVIVDAVHRLPSERAALAAIARKADAHFAGLWLDAPVDALVDRVAARARDASDATPAVVRRQAEEPLGVIEWQRLDALTGIDDLAAAALAAIGNGIS